MTNNIGGGTGLQCLLGFDELRCLSNLFDLWITSDDMIQYDNNMGGKTDSYVRCLIGADQIGEG